MSLKLVGEPLIEDIKTFFPSTIIPLLCKSKYCGDVPSIVLTVIPAFSNASAVPITFEFVLKITQQFTPRAFAAIIASTRSVKVS